MKTYEEAKKELDKEVNEHIEYIKHIKKTKSFDFKCPQCKKVKKVRVVSYNLGREGLKYCHQNCRAAAQRQRDKEKLINKIEGKFINEIDSLKEKIKELEDEKRERIS